MIEVIIPTRFRLNKLLACLESIPAACGSERISVTIVCDGDQKTAQAMTKEVMVDKVIYVREHRGSVYCRNLATQTVEDALICAVDDMVFQALAIREAAKVMRDKFPDDDGVVGFYRADRDHTKIEKTTGFYAGVSLVGQKFLQRFPNRRLFYPGYFLFAAQEMTNLAVKLGRIAMAERAPIFHYSPRKGGQMDRTHMEGRLWSRKDRGLMHQRTQEGQLWGER